MKKNRPCGGGLNISDIENCPTIITKRTPKKQRSFIYIASTGVNGFTENDSLKYCRLSSFRNYASELERTLKITLERIDEPNPDGIGSHYRYRIRSQQDAQKIVSLINKRAQAGGYEGIPESQAELILSPYPTE
ncbi:hypothetical protein LGZ99_05985 [Photorhabdus temperata]|uniref:Uncharacterized protein n=1 Tax=Photorhabdus temperata subsp. temperata Meg1 TaxID=1393735 RepID=A0A081RXC9_PHOTE|nr:hypothetical protein [Photorhabdus temperata]KER03332.1 hypothetical protein MEG1DRAFT_02010 [Photorhabdus temperata subsp. temperata Meg1]MCT8346773.1 hypothetical protein [Photorhabdus temperata]